MNKNSASQQRYADDSPETYWIQTSNTAGRSQRILQPVSLLKLVFDGLALILVLFAWLLFKFLVKPVRRAFLCSDLNLYHPPPVKKVFPTWLLFICAIVIPLIIIILSEGIRWRYLIRKQASKAIYKIQIGKTIRSIPEWFGNLYIIVGVFIFANGVNSFLTNVGKVAVGRLRPHFIPSCFGKHFYRDFCRDPYDWIVNYTCFGEISTSFKEKDDAYDIRQSFPSGHASTAFCGLIFLALYIHKVWNYRNMGLFPYVAEMLCFALAAYIGITRITDNRHHPTDVLGGAILGTFIAVIAFRYMVRSFKHSVLSDLGDESADY
jgi:phosphatidate phosphatase